LTVTVIAAPRLTATAQAPPVPDEASVIDSWGKEGRCQGICNLRLRCDVVEQIRDTLRTPECLL